MTYKTWHDTYDGSEVEVREVPENYDLHKFEIVVDGAFCGYVIPSDIESCNECRHALDTDGASDVIHWFDGCGHSVDFDPDSDFVQFWQAQEREAL